MKLIYPNHAKNIIYDREVNTFIKLLQKLQVEYDDVVWVAGSDRVSSYQELLKKYNGTEFTYRSAECVSAGERDPDAEGAAGMSAGIPNTLKDAQKLELMKQVRKGMGL